jgi:hypothetical protein
MPGTHPEPQGVSTTLLPIFPRSRAHLHQVTKDRSRKSHPPSTSKAPAERVKSKPRKVNTPPDRRKAHPAVAHNKPATTKTDTAPSVNSPIIKMKLIRYYDKADYERMSQPGYQAKFLEIPNLDDAAIYFELPNYKRFFYHLESGQVKLYTNTSIDSMGYVVKSWAADRLFREDNLAAIQRSIVATQMEPGKDKFAWAVKAFETCDKNGYLLPNPES